MTTDVKISDLPSAILPLGGTELIPVVQSNITRKAPVSSLIGAAATVAVGTTTTGAAGSSAAVSNSGSSSAAVLDFTIPRGDTGATGNTGSAATVTAGTTTTGAAGSSAAVVNSGSTSAAVLDFTVPRGDTGAKGDIGDTGPKGDTGNTGTAATATAGTTTTGAAGSSAAVVNSGSTSAAVFDFTIPRGDTGATGAKGDKGDTGNTGAAATATAGTTTTGAAGSSATVVNSGSTSAAVFDFTIPRGDTGNTGSAGTPGSVWYEGSGAPSGATGINGDYYLDVVNGDVYLKVTGSWSVVGNIKGPAGAGSGDVSGPAGATANAAVIFNATTGKLVKDSKVVITPVATLATLTIADNKTLTVNDTVTMGTGGLVLGNSGGLTVAASQVLTVSNAMTLSGSSSPTLAVTGTTAVSGTNTGDAASVPIAQNALLQEPTGFAAPDAVISTYDSTARTVTLTGTVSAYWQGTLVSALVSGWVSAAHTATTGGWYLYYNGSAFVWSQTPWTFDKMQIAYVWYGTADKFGIRETHGLMQWQTHEEFHQTVGTYLVSGGDMAGYTLASTTAANRRPTISATTVQDEDLETVNATLTSSLYTQLYLAGAGATPTWALDAAEIVPVLAANPYYNQFTGGAWQQTLLPNNAYMSVWLVAVPVMASTTGQKYRYQWIQGQSQSNSLTTIQAQTPSSLNLSALTSVSTEWVFIGKVIIRYAGSNWTFIQVDKLLGNKTSTVTSPAGSYLSAVTTDATLTGDGTAVSPLAVVYGTGVATAVAIAVGSAGSVVVNGGALGTPSSGTLTSCTFPTLNQNTSGYAEALRSATTTVSVSAATAPTTGQVLTATDSTHATWQTPSTGITPQTVGFTLSGGTTSKTFTGDADLTASLVAQIAASQAEMEAGTETALRTMTPERVKQAITALAPSTPEIVTPTNSSPANAATAITETPTLTGSTFYSNYGATHAATQVQVSTSSSFSSPLYSSGDQAGSVSFALPAGQLSVSTSYYWRVRYKNSKGTYSEWSTPTTFTTKSDFNDVISTPTATPTSFGDAFEGGFYTGLIWNELVESTTSIAIATGSKAFTVADMAATPIVYTGQVLEVRSRADPVNKFIGTVTGARGTTLTINVTSVGGSGTFTDWSVMAQYRVIVAPKASGENASIAFKNANTAAPSACGTLTEGLKATNAMVAADTSTVYPAAWWCHNLSIGGKTDWYLPARDELELAWRNLKPTADANYTTANRATGATPDYKNLGSYGDTANTHGLNNNSSPAGAAYSSGTPAQVAAGKNFRTGESEAFTYGSYYYWSASEYSTTDSWFQRWGSGGPGTQNIDSKAAAFYVRAVRRSII